MSAECCAIFHLVQGRETIGDFCSEAQCGLGKIVVDVGELAFKFDSSGNYGFRGKVKPAIKSKVMVPLGSVLGVDYLDYIANSTMYYRVAQLMASPFELYRFQVPKMILSTYSSALRKEVN